MFRLPYGDGEVSIDLPEEQLLYSIEPPLQPEEEGGPLDARTLLAQALANPIDSPPLEELVSPGDTVCLVVSDITRIWQRTPEYLPALVERLNECSVRDEDILVVIAVGTHRFQTEEEHRTILGELYGRVRVIDHDCDDEDHLVSVGTTSFGNEIRLNAHAMAADKLILTGGVLPHFIAGFGGGGKSILPGLSARDTVNRNHNMALNDGMGQGLRPTVHSGSISDNPVRQDMDEAAAMAQPCFAVNVVVDPAGKGIKRIFAGNYASVFREGVAYSNGLALVPVRQRSSFILVSAGGYPNDLNLRQSSKALHNALFLAEPHSTIILLAKCTDGFGDPQCKEQIEQFEDMRRREEAIRANFTIGAFIGFYFAEIAEHYNVILVSEFSKEVFKNTKVVPVSSMEEALETAKSLNGGVLDAPFVLMPKGGAVLPVLEEVV